VVFVSHDRYFLDKLATRVFEIGGGEVNVYPGNYEDYVWRKQGGAEKQPTLDDLLSGVPPAQPIPMPAPAQLPAAQKPRVNPLKLKQMQQRAAELESRSSALEAEIAETEQALAHYVSAEESTRLMVSLDAKRAELQAAESEWESLSSQIEATA
jgi:ATP-binding cassette subfamily F protein 3